MKNSFYTTLIAISFLATSCTDVIKLDLEDPKPLLVVDGYLSNKDTTQVLQLSSIENYFSTSKPNFEVFKGAKVELIENGVSVSTYLFNEKSLSFETKFQGIEGKEYQISIGLTNGINYLSATELMEPSVPIEDLWVEVNLTPGGPGPQGGAILVKLNTKEPIGVGDNYQWKTYLNDEYQSGRHDLFFQEDRLVDGQDVVGLDVFGMSEEHYNEYKDNSPNGKVFVSVEQSRISYRYFKYLLLIYQQLNQVGGPFASPPAEIRGNVYQTGKDEVLALGYFYTAAIDKKTIEIIE